MSSRLVGGESSNGAREPGENEPAGAPAEQARRDDEARFRGIFEQSLSGIEIYDAGGRLTEINPAARRIFGIDAAAVVLGFDLFADPNVPGDARARLERGEAVEYEAVFDFDVVKRDALYRTTRSGKCYLNCLLTPLRAADGSLTGYLAHVQEVTDRKMTEDALRQSEERFRALFEEASSPIQGYGPDGRVRLWNKASTWLYGYEKEEVVGRILAELIVPPEMHDAVRHAIQSGLDTGQVAPAGVHRLLRKDGSQVPVFISHAVIGRGSEDPELYCFQVDMTEREQFEARFQQAKKMEAVGTLAGGVAHRFNNALTVIVAGLDELEKSVSDPELRTSLLQPMKEASVQMSELTQQLLAYARGRKLQDERVSMADFVRHTLALLERTMKRSIFVETDLPPDLWPVKMDVAQMQTVLSELLRNASEAFEGQGRVRITCRNVEDASEEMKALPAVTPGSYVSLAVRDSGKGMDDATKSRAFEPFFTTKFLGRGLGLPAVYGILKSHGGWIALDSDPGKGTTATIYLPAIAAA